MKTKAQQVGDILASCMSLTKPSSLTKGPSANDNDGVHFESNTSSGISKNRPPTREHSMSPSDEEVDLHLGKSSSVSSDSVSEIVVLKQQMNHVNAKLDQLTEMMAGQCYDYNDGSYEYDFYTDTLPGQSSDNPVDRPSTSTDTSVDWAPPNNLKDQPQPEQSLGESKEDTDTLLDQLVQQVTSTAQCGPKIDSVQITSIIDAVGKSGMNDKARDDLVKATVRPENCPLLSVAKVNSELWELIRADTRARDAKLQHVLHTLLAGIVPVVNLTDAIITSVNTDAYMPSRTVMVKSLTQAITLLMQVKHEIDLKRRDFIRPDLQYEYKALCSQRNEVTDQLFGDDLQKSIKDIGEANRVTSRVQRGGYSFRGRGRAGFSPRGRSPGFRGRFLSRGPRRGSYPRNQGQSRGRGTNSQK